MTASETDYDKALARFHRKVEAIAVEYNRDCEEARELMQNNLAFAVSEYKDEVAALDAQGGGEEVILKVEGTGVPGD